MSGPFYCSLSPQGGPSCGLGPGAQKVQKKGDKGPFDVEALDEIRMRCVVKLEKQVSVGWFRWCDRAGGLQSSGEPRGQVQGEAMAQSTRCPGGLRRAQVSPAASAEVFSFSIGMSSSLRAYCLRLPLVPNDQSAVWEIEASRKGIYTGTENHQVHWKNGL